MEPISAHLLAGAHTCPAATLPFQQLRGHLPPLPHPPHTTGGAQEGPRSPSFLASPRPAAPVRFITPHSRSSAVGGASLQFPRLCSITTSSPVPGCSSVGEGRTAQGDSGVKFSGSYLAAPMVSGVVGTPPVAQPQPLHPLPLELPAPAHSCVPASPSRMCHRPWRCAPPSSELSSPEPLPALWPQVCKLQHDHSSALVPPAWDRQSGQRCSPPAT